MKTILVTGATGFCGRILCKQLIKNKRSKIIGTFLNPVKAHLSGVRFVRLNIEQPKDVFQLIAKVCPDEIYHLAAQSNDRNSWKIPGHTLSANTLAVANLLEAIRMKCPKSKILLVSTAQVHARSFKDGMKMPETSLIWPRSPYGFSKALAELISIQYAQAFNLHVVVARSYNHLGPGQDPMYVFPDWCKQIAEIEAGKKEPTIKVGNLDVRRDFLHAEDVASAYQILMKRGKSGEVYNVCSSSAIPLKRYAAYLKKKSKIPIDIYSDETKLRPQDVLSARGSSAKLRSLGWKPKHTVYEALDEILDEWRNRIN